VTKRSEKWKKTLVYQREPSGTQVEEIQDLIRKSERLEKNEVKDKYNAQRHIKAGFVTSLHKPGISYCDHATLNTHPERQEFYVIVSPQSPSHFLPPEE